VAHAQWDPGNTCTDQTVVGTYGFDGQGVLGFGTHQAIQAAETGMLAFGINPQGDVVRMFFDYAGNTRGFVVNRSPRLR
jgi:hypothetical protein